jgi:hypothetical protein
MVNSTRRTAAAILALGLGGFVVGIAAADPPPASQPDQPVQPPQPTPVPTAPATEAPTTVVLPAPVQAPNFKPAPQERHHFPIDPKTPAKDLLPPAPKARTAVPVVSDDLTQVPEVELLSTAEHKPAGADAVKETAHALARINHLNGRKTDGFVEVLRAERADLAGLPFVMGDACRTKGERSRQFNLAVTTVRRVLSPSPQAVAFNFAVQAGGCTVVQSTGQPVPP